MALHHWDIDMNFILQPTRNKDFKEDKDKKKDIKKFLL